MSLSPEIIAQMESVLGEHGLECVQPDGSYVPVENKVAKVLILMSPDNYCHTHRFSNDGNTMFQTRLRDAVGADAVDALYLSVLAGGWPEA